MTTNHYRKGIMTHKDFKLIAAALAEAEADGTTIRILADALRGTNPRFDRGRFIAAASGSPSHGRDRVQGVHSHA